MDMQCNNPVNMTQKTPSKDKLAASFTQDGLENVTIKHSTCKRDKKKNSE